MSGGRSPVTGPPPRSRRKRHRGAVRTIPPKTHKTVESKDVEVEISDRWSLLMPDKPTGLACGGSAASASAITINNPDKGNRVANYPNDRWDLTGKLNIQSIPLCHPHQRQGQCRGPDRHLRAQPLSRLGRRQRRDSAGNRPEPAGLSGISAPGAASIIIATLTAATTRYAFMPSPRRTSSRGAPDALAAAYDEVMNNAQSAVEPVAASASGYHPYLKVIKGIQTARGPEFSIFRTKRAPISTE